MDMIAESARRNPAKLADIGRREATKQEEEHMHQIITILWLPGIVATALAGGPAIAQQNQAVSDDATEVVCRRSPSAPGSRLGRRNICKTQAQWDAEQAQYSGEIRRQKDLSSQSFGACDFDAGFC